MKIRVGTITYNNKTDINNLLESLFSSDLVEHDYSIEIINNHSNFELRDEFLGKVDVIHNRVRPDFSTGHMAKDYNSILVRGFENLDAPAHDIVILIQEDNVVKPDFISHLLRLHETYNYIAAGVGGQLQSFTADAIKKIGLFDERYASIGIMDSDYFIRAVIWNRKYSSINDVQGRMINPTTNEIEGGFYEETRTDSILIRCVKLSQEHLTALAPIWAQPHIVYRVFHHIWGADTQQVNWSPEYIDWIESSLRPLHKPYIMYPYFEDKVENMSEKYEVI